MTERMNRTEPPHIEDVLEKYADIPGLTMMALGSSYWGPPDEAFTRLTTDLRLREVQRYGNVTGDLRLKEKITKLLASRGLNMNDMEITITAGANQACLDVVMATCDGHTDKAILLAPYYFSHKLTMQLSEVDVSVCPFDSHTLYPQWDELERMLLTLSPKLVIMTTPSNPGGLVWSHENIEKLVNLCRLSSSWLVVDQTYYEFLFDDAVHTFPCGSPAQFNYDKIVHIFSFSKSFGMPGWRVGYLVHPVELSPHFRKIQDTIPTHTSIASQKLAIRCMEIDEEYGSNVSVESDHTTTNPASICPASTVRSLTWVQNTVATLNNVRTALWPILQPLGTVYTTGAFYFLVPVPKGVSDDEAVDILARQYGVLLMPGWPFGAPQHLRLSYGGIAPEQVLTAVEQLQKGFQALKTLGESRVG